MRKNDKSMRQWWDIIKRWIVEKTAAKTSSVTLRSKHQADQREIVQLQRQIESLKEEIRNLENDNLRLKYYNIDLQLQNGELKSRTSTLESEKAELNARIENLQGKLQLLEESLDVYTYTVEDFARHSRGTLDLVHYINKRGYRIMPKGNIPIWPREYIEVARLIGKNYHVHLVSELLRVLKQSASIKQPKSLDVAKEDKSDIAVVVDLCRKMHACGLIHKFSYGGNNRYICKLKVNTDNEHHVGFVTGVWLELFARYELCAMIQSVNGGKIPPHIHGLKIKSRHGRWHELDFLLKIQDQYIWMEMTTGDYYKDVEKMRELREPLEFDQYVLVVTDVGASRAEEIRMNEDIEVVRVENFEEDCRRIIQRAS